MAYLYLNLLSPGYLFNISSKGEDTVAYSPTGSMAWETEMGTPPKGKKVKPGT